jgi:hypothetical protein
LKLAGSDSSLLENADTNDKLAKMYPQVVGKHEAEERGSKYPDID